MRPRSRGAICARVLPSHYKKGPSHKSEGSGAPRDASSEERARHSGAAAGLILFLLPACGGSQEGGPLAFRRSTAVVPAWAALPGITGCKREDPPRRQCSEHLAVRSRAGRDVAQNRPLPLRLKEYPREGVRRERDGDYVTVSVTIVNNVLKTETRRHCEERSDEAIQTSRPSGQAKDWIASLRSQ
jgi:hypothetical protein